MATVEEVEVLISKIRSEKSKLRDEGVKELLSYLDGSGGVSLCPLLDRQSANFSHFDKLLSSTWQGIVRALCQCNKMEYSSSKKRAPKPIFSKALRNVIQKMEERIRTGACVLLAQDIRNLFSHLLEGIIEAPSFLSDYSHVLRQLLSVSDYCSQMTRPVYAKFVLFFLEKMKALVHENTTEISLSKEEAFRTATILQSLLQNPSDHFMEKVREPLIEGFSNIFMHLSNEGRVARKLLASLNMLLLKDGVNLGDLLIDIHSSIKGFVARTWKVTRDRELKDELVLYGRLQLKLRAVVVFLEGEFIEEMLQLVEKDLDQACALTFLSGSYRFDGGRDGGKSCTVTIGMRHFLEFSASILFQASLNAGSRGLTSSKKQKKQDVFATLTERLNNGNTLWWGTFCLLVRTHYQGISLEVMFQWLKNLCGILERFLSDASRSTQNFESLIWILRCLQELCLVWPAVLCIKKRETTPLTYQDKSKSLWESVWIMLLQWIPLFSGTAILVEESFKLLGYLLLQKLLSIYPVPQDFWSLRPFTETPCGSVLFFIASFFSCSPQQVPFFEDLELWKKLLTWSVLTPDKQEYLQLKSAAILSLSTGYVPQSLQHLSKSSCFFQELDDWAKVEHLGETTEKDLHALDKIEISLAECGFSEFDQIAITQQTRNNPFPVTQVLLKELADVIVKKVSMLTEPKTQGILEQSLNFASIIMSCMCNIVSTLQGRDQVNQEWSSEGRVYEALSRIVSNCISIVKDSANELLQIKDDVPLDSLCQSVSDVFLSDRRKSLSMLLSGKSRISEYQADNVGQFLTLLPLFESFLFSIDSLFKACRGFQGTVDASCGTFPCNIDYVAEEAVDARILDADFDNVSRAVVKDSSCAYDTSTGDHLNFKQKWMIDCVTIITLFASRLPEKTCDILLGLLREEEHPKVRRKIILSLCRSVTYNRPDHVVFVVDDLRSESQSITRSLGMDAYFVVIAVNTLLKTLLASKEIYGTLESDRSEGKWSHSEKVFKELAKLLDDTSQNNFPFWHLRWKFAKAIKKLNILDPVATEVLLDKFLGMLHDVDYRVRWIMSKTIDVLFQVYTGHQDLLQDICSNIGLKMVMTTKEKTVTAAEVSLTTKDRCLAETALITLAEVAAASEKVEVEAVFVICANAAVFPCVRFLSRVTLDRLARKMQYPNRWKYLSHHLCSIFSFWVKVQLPLPTLVEIRELLVYKLEPIDFLNYCCPWVLPSLLFYGRDNELKWLAKVISKSISDLVKEFSAAIFSALLPLYCHGDEAEKRVAVSVLQGKMLVLANLSEDDRDKLIKKNMVSIVNGVLQLCSSTEQPSFPLFSKKDVISSVQIVVDGFCGSESFVCQKGNDMVGVEDVLKIFRADRVFMFILQIHLQIKSAFNSRHCRAKMAGLACLIYVIRKNVAVPIICRYLFHILLQSLELRDLCEDCCEIIGDILNILSTLPKEVSSEVLGPQLQLVVSHLVSICIALFEKDGVIDVTSSPVYALLERVTIHGDPSTHGYIKELAPFPELPCFERIRTFHSRLCAKFNVVFDFAKFVVKISELPRSLQLKSLQNLHRVYMSNKESFLVQGGCFNTWNDTQKQALALLKFVRQCIGYNISDVIDFAGDFIARMGIKDPHAVVLGLPENSDCVPFIHPGNTLSMGTEQTNGVSEDLCKMILLQLKNYLIDEDVLVIELAAQTLKGLLSTDKGHKVLNSMEAKDTTFIDIFSRGVNHNTVENMLTLMRAESTKKSIPLENDILWDVSHQTYDEWVCSLVYCLMHYCEDTVLRLCQGVVHCKVSLAESLLPHVLGSLAMTNGISSNICKLISIQVERHIFSGKNHNTRSIQLFIDALNELRHCDVLAHMKLGGEYKNRRVNAKVYWLDIDYLKTAKVAQKCGAYFTSALYIEHWCEEKYGRLSLGEPDFSDDEELPTHVELLLEVYSRINEPDGVYGVVQSHKLMPQVLIYEHEGNWSKAVEGYDLLLRNKDFMSSAKMKSTASNTFLIEEMEAVASPNQFEYNKSLMRSLQQTGCDHILKMYCTGLSMERETLERNAEFQELQYESAWRAGKWNFYSIFPKIDNEFDALEYPGRINFHANLYCCLRSLYDGDRELFSSQTKLAKQELVRLISLTSLESASNIFPSIIKLQILDCLCKSWGLRWNHLEESGKVIGPYIPSIDQMTTIDQDWKHRLSQMQHQFDLFEPFVTFRKVLHQVLGCEESIPHQILEFATFARKAGRINQAAAAIYELKQYYKKRKFGTDSTTGLEKISMPASAKVQEAKILWAQGHHEIAVNLLKYVINHCNVHEDSASVYCLAGKWLASTHSDSARIILTQYLHKAVKISERLSNKSSSKYVEEKCRACYRLAHYSDSLYRSYKERLNSSEWQNALRLRKHREKEVEVLCRKLKDAWKTLEKKDSMKKGTMNVEDERIDYAKKVAELQKQLAMDNEEAQRLQSDKDSFLKIALDSYRCCLATGDKYDLRVVFKITSLWFDLSGQKEVINSMLEIVKEVKSHKFLPLVYQIASRLGSLKDVKEQPSFQYALTSLVRKMAVEHPYHTIYQLLALANGDRVKDKQRSKAAFIIDLDKKQAAEALLNTLMSEKKQIILQMKQLVEIYIKLAEIDVKKEDMNKKLTLPRDIRSVRQLELVPVITASLPISPDATYPEGSFPYFKGLSDRITVMMGINAPKVVECLGSDGNYYRQLAKSGNDDLRQDAVMEQLFSLVNSLLQHHPDTQKRRLSIRTYKVIPFTPSAGVLEWVDGTMPLGEYLLGSNRIGGAHARYRQADWTFPKCRAHMFDQQDKRNAFQLVCQNFRPVFHYFFLEKFSHPAEWYNKRLAYTRSVAASSMVGYIVGLGDRHAMNILIDQQTAEVVHIDLGVAFEQGLMLKMPERVPFRLTRDIVDGMGVTGVEGVFRRCCEEALLVMRTNKDALLTIIEVFIHDPLYKWALSPLKALQRQKDTIDLDETKDDNAETDNEGEANEGNRDAARALMRVKQKLDGYEGGDIRSVQGQVQQLIQDAQDSDKLCQMFPGWGAWL